MYPIAKLTCALALSATAMCAQTVSTLSVKTTGMVGIAEGETARLNLLNPGVLPPAVGVVCTASVTFFDANDTALKTANLTVLPGKSQSVDLHSDTDLSLASNQRRANHRAELLQTRGDVRNLRFAHRPHAGVDRPHRQHRVGDGQPGPAIAFLWKEGAATGGSWLSNRRGFDFYTSLRCATSPLLSPIFSG